MLEYGLFIKAKKSYSETNLLSIMFKLDRIRSFTKVTKKPKKIDGTDPVKFHIRVHQVEGKVIKQKKTYTVRKNKIKIDFFKLTLCIHSYPQIRTNGSKSILPTQTKLLFFRIRAVFLKPGVATHLCVAKILQCVAIKNTIQSGKFASAVNR